MAWLYAYLAVGGLFLVTGAFRGLYDLSKREVTVLLPGGGRRTAETREVPEFLVTVALTLLAWPIFPASWIHQNVIGPARDRRWQRQLAQSEDGA